MICRSQFWVCDDNQSIKKSLSQLSKELKCLELVLTVSTSSRRFMFDKEKYELHL